MLLKSSTWDRSYQCRAAVLLWQRAFGDDLACRASFQSSSEALWGLKWHLPVERLLPDGMNKLSLCRKNVSGSKGCWGEAGCGSNQPIQSVFVMVGNPRLVYCAALQKASKENWNSWGTFCSSEGAQVLLLPVEPQQASFIGSDVSATFTRADKPRPEGW